MAVNDKLARVFISHPSQTRCLKAEEIKEGDKDIILNQFLKKDEELSLGDVKECFISFKNLKATSKIFKEGGFLGKLGVDGKDYAFTGGVFYYNKKNFTLIKNVLEDDEMVCIHPVVKLCLSNISVSSEKDATDIATFCGFTQTLSPTAKHTVSIGSNLEIIESCGERNGFYDLLFKEFYNSFDYDKTIPNGFERQANAEDFLWILNFQSRGSDCVCNHWLTFKAKITGAGISRDAVNPISEFAPNLAVQGGIAHERNCEPMIIFGDKEPLEKKEEEAEEDKKVKAFVSEAQEYLNRAYEQLKGGILSKEDYTDEIAELSMGLEELKPIAEKMLKKQITKRADIEEQLLNKAFELKGLNKENKFAKDFINNATNKLCTWFCSGDTNKSKTKGN